MPTPLRPKEVTDLPAFCEALARWLPGDTTTLRNLEGRDATRGPGERCCRLWAMRGPERAGLLALDFPRAENQAGWQSLKVAAQGQDPAVLDWLVAQGLKRAAAWDAHTVVARVREGTPEAAAYLRAGFAEYDRMFTSRLDLQALDLAPFAAREALVRAAGVQIVPLSVAAQALGGWHAEGAQRRLYALIVSRLAAVPGVVSIQPWSFEVWVERTGKHLDPAGVMVAVSPAGDWVGLTELFLEPEPGVLHTGLTGVEPQWQGRGVALSLKVAALRAAQARGSREVLTSNHARNAAMLGINRALGFVPDPATLLLRRGL